MKQLFINGVQCHFDNVVLVWNMYALLKDLDNNQYVPLLTTGVEFYIGRINYQDKDFSLFDQYSKNSNFDYKSYVRLFNINPIDCSRVIGRYYVSLWKFSELEVVDEIYKVPPFRLRYHACMIRVWLRQLHKSLGFAVYT